MRGAHGPGERGEIFVYQGMALNADERDWLTDARREWREASGEKQSFGLALLVSTLATNREAGELEYVAHRLWAEAQLKRLQEGQQ
jgi:hypothetical protein